MKTQQRPLTFLHNYTFWVQGAILFFLITIIIFTASFIAYGLNSLIGFVTGNNPLFTPFWLATSFFLAFSVIASFLQENANIKEKKQP